MRGGRPWLVESQIFPTRRGQHAAARGALQQALLDEIGLDHLLDAVALLGERRGQGVDPDRSATVVVGDASQVAPVHRIQPAAVHVETAQGGVGVLGVDAAAAEGGEIAHPAQQPAGHPRGAARAPRDLGGGAVAEIDVQHACAAVQDPHQVVGLVEVEAHGDAEALPQRRGQQPRAGGGANQRERRQVDAHRPRRRPLADDQVQPEVLHCRIEHLLDRRVQAVDLVDKQDVARLQVGQQCRQVAGPHHHRAGGGPESDLQLAGDDLRQRRLAQARRAVQQDVVEGVAAGPRRGDEDAQVVA